LKSLALFNEAIAYNFTLLRRIYPDKKLPTGSNVFDGKQLRRIEIRVRRKQQD